MLFRHNSGFAIVLEQSADMVPGMLYSRMRPGLNHLAFPLDSEQQLSRILEEAAEHGWSAMPVDRHPIVGGAQVSYLEDRDGFEVELVARTAGLTGSAATRVGRAAILSTDDQPRCT